MAVQILKFWVFAEINLIILIQSGKTSVYQKRDQKIEQTPGPGYYNQSIAYNNDVIYDAHNQSRLNHKAAMYQNHERIFHSKVI